MVAILGRVGRVFVGNRKSDSFHQKTRAVGLFYEISSYDSHNVLGADGSGHGEERRGRMETIGDVGLERIK